MVHPWDAAIDNSEWQAWLGDGRDFGQLVVNDVAGWPAVVPTHFAVDDDRTVLLHLARPNPMWHLIGPRPGVVLAVVDDDADVPSTWRAPDGPRREGVSTSGDAAVHLRCRAEIVDDPSDEAELLRRQLGPVQPEHDHAPIAVDEAPYGRLLPGIRGLRLHGVDVVATSTSDEHEPAEHRRAVADRLQQRGQGHDHGARSQQLRRLDTSGTGPT